jgi:hypothetical protein
MSICDSCEGEYDERTQGAMDGNCERCAPFGDTDESYEDDLSSESEF